MSLIMAAGLVLVRQQAGLWQFLLLQANSGDFHWSPPQAILKDDEQFIPGVYRALNEQTGFAKADVTLLDFRQQVINPINNGNDRKQVMYTLGKYIGNGKTVKLHSKHKAFKWAPLSEARELVGCQKMKDLLDKAHSRLQK